MTAVSRFTEYQAELVRQKKEQFRHIAVFPCKLRILPEHVYTRRDPIVVGVRVEAGGAKTGKPICVPTKEFIFLGILTGIQHNNKDVDTAEKGDEVRSARVYQEISMRNILTICFQVCIKIEAPGGDAPKMFGRHFDDKDLLMSRVSDLLVRVGSCTNNFCLQISRESIDACKDYFRDELTKSDWGLMVELKKIFEIL